MARKYHKNFISKNGNNYYLQFHIKDWMRLLPDFKNLPETKKNYKETLKTSDFNLAYERANKKLKELQIIERPKYKPLLVGAESYWKGTEDFKTMTDNDLDEMYDYYLDMINGSSVSDHIHEFKVTDEKHFSHAENKLRAIEREKEKRTTKFFDKPHPYPVGLSVMSNKYMEELKSEGKPTKTQNKVKNATIRFLDYREQTDIELRLISPKIVNDYIKFARDENRASTTFSNDMSYLAAVYSYAVRQSYLDNSPNPFKGHRLKNFKKTINRKPFTNEMITKLLELSSKDEELTQLIYVSYYTGMRLDEIFNAKLDKVENTRIFKVAENGGKTESAKRIIPIHSELKKMKLSEWKSPSSTALGKRFGRLKDKMLEQMGFENEKKVYVHHSFRHGFITLLLQKGYHELEFSDITGHKKSNIGRTQAGKSYFAKQDISKLIEIVESIPKI